MESRPRWQCGGMIKNYALFAVQVVVVILTVSSGPAHIAGQEKPLLPRRNVYVQHESRDVHKGVYGVYDAYGLDLLDKDHSIRYRISLICSDRSSDKPDQFSVKPYLPDEDMTVLGLKIACADVAFPIVGQTYPVDVSGNGIFFYKRPGIVDPINAWNIEEADATTPCKQ